MSEPKINVKFDGDSYIKYLKYKNKKNKFSKNDKIAILYVIGIITVILASFMIVDVLTPPPSYTTYPPVNIKGFYIPNGIVTIGLLFIGVAWLLHGVGFTIIKR